MSKMISRYCLLILVLIGGVILAEGQSPIYAAETHVRHKEVIDKEWDAKDKRVKRLEINQGFAGYRNTLIFYTDSKSRLVLKITIGNKSKKFPIAATLFEFDEKTTEEGLKKWLNNQHSDGLFPDVPEPKKTTKVPVSAFRLDSSKLIGQTNQRLGKFDKYSVGFKFISMAKVGNVKIKTFRDEAKVYLKSE